MYLAANYHANNLWRIRNWRDYTLVKRFSIGKHHRSLTLRRMGTADNFYSRELSALKHSNTVELHSRNLLNVCERNCPNRALRPTLCDWDQSWVPAVIGTRETAAEGTTHVRNSVGFSEPSLWCHCTTYHKYKLSLWRRHVNVRPINITHMWL